MIAELEVSPNPSIINSFVLEFCELGIFYFLFFSIQCSAFSIKLQSFFLASLEMSILEMSPLEEVESVCFSDVEEGGSCYSQFYSTADGYDDCCGSECEIVEERVVARRLSSVGQPDISVEIKVVLEGGEKDCRICHLGLESSGGENGGAIELGCSCKDDLAAAHKNCAETWFKIKGNKTCEICNSVARNVVVPSEAETVQQTNELHAISRGSMSSTSDTRSCFNGHRFMNFLLACMVFAFIISWLFHFDIPN